MEEFYKSNYKPLTLKAFNGTNSTCILYGANKLNNYFLTYLLVLANLMLYVVKITKKMVYFFEVVMKY